MSALVPACLRPGRTTRRALGVAVLALGIAAAPAVAAAPVTRYQMPFVCGDPWTGDTRATHSPSSLAIDWNRDNDLGRLVVAPAPGVVSRLENLGSRSYGLFVVVDHGNGESTLYAHLSAEYVSLGQRLDAGQPIGAVGTSGGSTGPHLHWEERRSGTVVRPYLDGVPFVFGSTLASRNCPDIPLAGDWNNDGKDDLGTFNRRYRGNFRQLVAGSVRTVKLARGIDEPVTGDFDGDGRTDLGVRRTLESRFLLRTAAGVTSEVPLGILGDRPAVGDWNGDGTTDLGIYRTVTGRFRLKLPDGTIKVVPLGSPGLEPVTGDWNGDGRTDLGVYDRTLATYTLRMAGRDGTVWNATVKLGSPGDLPVVGDWDGDRGTDLATWRPSSATWTLRMADGAMTGSARVVTRTFGTPR